MRAQPYADTVETLIAIEDVERVEGLLAEDAKLQDLYGINSAFADGKELNRRQQKHVDWLRRDPAVPSTPRDPAELFAEFEAGMREAAKRPGPKNVRVKH